MTPTECIDFVSVTNEVDLIETEHRLEPAMPEAWAEGWIRTGLKNGHYFVVDTHVSGRKMYRYLFHKNDQSKLFINASLYIGEPGQGDDWLWMIGAEMIARKNKCGAIVFISSRRGHLEQGRRAGFKVVGVEMEKNLEHHAIPE